jgi:hypothetical protein
LEKLEHLAKAIGLSTDDEERAKALFRTMTPGWASVSVGDLPPWPTDITDDGTPFEFSLAFEGGTPDLRMLVESQTMPLSSASSWDAGLELNQRLEASGAHVVPFERVKGLFTPSAGPVGSFCLWHGAALKRDRTLFKAYLNPQVHGSGAATGLIERALRRLGRADAWEFLSERLNASERGKDIRYLSLDLEQSNAARIKVYLASTTVESAERVARGSRNIVPGDVAGTLSVLTGSSGPYWARPILTCLAFDEHRFAPKTTLHVPVRCYLSSDEECRAKASTLLDAHAAETLARAIRALGGDPPAASSGVVTYVSVTPAQGGGRVTIYLAPRCFTVSASRALPTPGTKPSGVHRIEVNVRQAGANENALRTTMRDVEAAIDHHRRAIAEHPFIKRLEGPGHPEELRTLARRLAFLPLVFQDVLRLNKKLSTDERFAKIASSMADSDQGHEEWYLDDAKLLGVAPSVRWLFSEAHEPTRDAAYSLVSQILTANDDFTRLAVVLSLEAAAGEFLARVPAFADRSGVGIGLKYFGTPHFDAERGHEVFEEAQQEVLGAIEVPRDVIPSVLAAIENTFATMALLADDLVRAMAYARTG